MEGVLNKDKVFRTTQINFYDCVHPLMSSTEDMNVFLLELVDFIKMRPIPDNITNIANPASFEVTEFDVKEPTDTGVTGTVILFESHASAHAWDKLNMLCIVVCSCKDYDPYQLVLWAVKYTGANIYKMDTIIF